MDLTLREFENLNLYSNKNMEKVIGKLINESSNAVLVNIFDDSLVLLDHDEGQFYTADYKFDESNLQLNLDNFEKVELVKEEEDFREDVSDFFDDEDSFAKNLIESYKENVIGQEKYVNELISESMSVKDFSEYADYGSLKEAKKEMVFESTNEDFFKIYKERLNTHPLNEIKYVDWENPITVSLVETEKKSLINNSVLEKAKDLWKKPSFKQTFLEAVEELVNEESDESMIALFEQFPSLFYLEENDRDTLFGKAIISSPLSEHRKAVSKTINELLAENEDIAELKNKYVVEEEEDDEGEEAPEGEVEGEVEVEVEEKAPELTVEQAKKMVADLSKAKEAIEDEVMKEKIDNIIISLKNTEEEGTKPKDVKEAVAILSL
jgi:hypothetical protein